MRQRRLASLLSVGLLLWACGCASVRPENPPASPSERSLPQPADVSISASLKLDLPAPIAQQANIPPLMLGTFRLTLRCTAIEARPPRSRFEGKVTATFRDPEGKHTYADFASDLRGEYNGSPDEGFLKVIEHLAGAVDLFHRTAPGQASGK